MIMCKLSQSAVSDILRHGRIYEVGGAVRDRLLLSGSHVHDRDYLVTGIPYDRLSRILRGYGRVDLVGRSFGVIKFTQTIAGKPRTFDIALPRTEHSTGVGHKQFQVRFDPGLSVEDDLARRDFTVNAMAWAVDSEELIDPLGGLVDLKRRQLRMVYDDSFKDDPLRMLRAIQFAARLEFAIEPHTHSELVRHAPMIASVSAERIAEELNKLLLMAGRPSAGFRLMQETGLLKHVLPELEAGVGVDQPGGYHAYDVFEHTVRTIDACPERLPLRMAALFHDITKPQHKQVVEDGATFYGHENSGARVARRVMRRLRYSNDLIKDVVTLIERHMFTTDVTDKGLRRLIRRVGPELIFDLLDLRRADVEAQGRGGMTDDVDRFETDIRAELSRKPPFGLSDLAVDGDALMKLLNLEEGPVIGEVLGHLLEVVLDDPALNTSETLKAEAREYYEKRTRTQPR